jgi:Transposase DDE domain
MTSSEKVVYARRSVEVDFAVDSSGERSSRPLSWYNTRYGHEQENHDWMKLHLMCGVKTNIVTSVEITGSYANDSPQLRPLVETSAQNFRLRDGDAGKANLELVTALGGTPYVPEHNRGRTSSVARVGSAFPTLTSALMLSLPCG